MANEMEMDVEMDAGPFDCNYTEVFVKEGINNEQMELESAGAIFPRSSLKKSSLSRNRGPMPFNKRKKVSFDNTATQSSGGGRRARSLSPPYSRRTTFKLKRQSEEYVSPTSPPPTASNVSGPEFLYSQKTSDSDDEIME